MKYTQDGIEYKIKESKIKGWKGTPPFKKPLWDGIKVVEGWTADDDAAQAAQDAAQAARDAKLKDLVVIYEGVTKVTFQPFAVVVNDRRKLKVIEL